MTTMMVARLPIPNHSTNNGTQANDGIGISTLNKGENVRSALCDVPIAIPIGMAIAKEILNPNRTRNIVEPVCTKIWPSSNISFKRDKTSHSGGVNAFEYRPLRANISQMTRAQQNPARPRYNVRQGKLDLFFSFTLSPFPNEQRFDVQFVQIFVSQERHRSNLSKQS